tara:strand:- start:1721 stop:2302 length:582 start_codon:yes stop_codon:yes gene_type:complete
MGTIKIKDADGAEQYIKTGSGAGTSGDPYVPENTLTAGNSITIASGTAAIGVVDIGPQTAIAAGAAAAAALTGNTVQLATDTLRNGTTSVTPVFAVINVASTGSAQEIVAAAGASNKIRVLALNIVVGDAVNVYVASATTPITGQWEFNGKGDGIVLPFSPVGWFETTANVALNLFLSAAVSVDGSVTYVVVQ